MCTVIDRRSTRKHLIHVVKSRYKDKSMYDAYGETVKELKTTIVAYAINIHLDDAVGK